jgi:hypothetical protein
MSSDALRLVGRFLGVALNRTVEEVVEARMAPVREAREALRSALVAVLRGLPAGSALLLRADDPRAVCMEYEAAEVIAEVEAGRVRDVMVVRCGPPREYPPERTEAAREYPGAASPPEVDHQAMRAKASLAALLASLPAGTRVEVRSEALAKLGQSSVGSDWLAAQALEGRFYDLVAVRLPQPKAPKPGEAKRSTTEIVAAVDGAVDGLLASLSVSRAPADGGGDGEVRGSVGRRKVAVGRRKSA